MRARVEKVDVLGWNKSNIVNSVSTIAAESSDVASAAAMNDLSNDQDSVEVDYSKKKEWGIFCARSHEKCNDGNDT